MLRHGYNRGLPAGTDTAWGCRAVVDQDGLVDVPPDRTDLVGPHRGQLADHLGGHVGAVWRDRASELLRTGVMHPRRAGEFVLYKDRTVVIKGNTLASDGHLYVCAYLIPHANEQ